MHLIFRNRRDSDQIAALLVIGRDHLRKAGMGTVMQHIGQQQSERFVADDLSRAPHGMAQSQRCLLPREARLTRSREIAGQKVEFIALAALGQGALAAPGPGRPSGARGLPLLRRQLSRPGPRPAAPGGPTSDGPATIAPPGAT